MDRLRKHVDEGDNLSHAIGTEAEAHREGPAVLQHDWDTCQMGGGVPHFNLDMLR